MTGFDPIQDLGQRITALERLAATYRQGVVVSVSPLTVTLGGSSTPVSAKALDSVGVVAVGQVVSVLTFGNDLIVLGPIGYAPTALGSLYSEVTTVQSTSSGTFTDLGTVGPSITLPIAGDYDVTIGCRAYSASAGTAALMSYDIGATPASSNDALDFYCGAVVGGVASTVGHSTRTRRKTGLGAVTLTAKYSTSGGASWNFGHRWISAVRVG